MKKQWILLVAAIFIASTIFMSIGCAADAPAPVEEPAAPADEPAEPAEEPAEPAEDIRIASYWPEAHPYYESVQQGIQRFTEDYGVPVSIQIGTGWDMQTQIEQVEALAAQGYQGIKVFPVDAAGSNALYEDIVAQDIFVASYGAQTLVPTPASFTLATDVKAAAMAATERVIEEMGGSGNILNILEFVEDPNTILRDEGINEVVDTYPDVQIIQTVAGMASIEEATEKISNALAGLGDEVDGMVTTGYQPTVAAAQILTEMENDRIAYVGIDDDPIVLRAIEEGYVTGTFAQNPYFQGYVTPVLLMYLIQGYESKGFEFIDTFGIVVTQDNLDTFADELWQASYDAAENALANWFK